MSSGAEVICDHGAAAGTRLQYRLDMTMRMQLEQFFADRDVACPSCGYNLRNLAGDQCPECGEELVLRVGLAEPHTTSFVTGVIGLAVGLGFHGFLVLWILVVSLRQPFTMWRAASPIVVGLIGCSAGLWLWLSRQRRVRRLPRGRRRFAVFLCWAYSVATVFAFFALAR